MNKHVWVSGALGNHDLGNKLGIGWKYYGHDWSAPTHIIPPIPEAIRKNMKRHVSGETLEREEFPEACYVFDEKRFGRIKDFFYLGGFAAVKGKLAEVLANADFGTGGLVRIPIYEADKKTELPGPYFALNFCQKEDTFCPQQSIKLKSIFTFSQDGKELWRSYGSGDDEIAVTSKALDGPDLWIDPKLKSKIFLSDSLVSSLKEAKVLKDYLRITRCKVVD